MKILFYIHSLVVGGAETIVTNNLISLKEKGIEVALVVNHNVDSFLQQRVNKSNIVIHPLDRKKPTGKLKQLVWKIEGRFKNYKKIVDNIIRIEKPDIIHINTLINRFNNVTFPRDKIVYTFHSEIERSLEMNGRKNANIIKKYSLKGMNFFALNNSMIEDIKDKYNTKNIYKITNYIDVKKIMTSRYEKTAFLRGLGIPEESYVLGHVGSFRSVKNHERVISIFSELHSRKPNSYLVLVGGDVNNRVSKIERIAKGLGIGDHIKILGIRDDAPSIMSCFDGFVLPSYSESFSLVLVEAQVHKIRCIASDNVPEDVFCNENCFRLSLDEPDCVWVDLLLGDEKQNRKKSIREFDIDFVTNKMIEAYQEIINNPK